MANKKKLYSIGELIDENIKLKKRIDNIVKGNQQNLINIIKIIEPWVMFGCPLDLKKLREGLENGLD